jgi:hypothetical protein
MDMHFVQQYFEHYDKVPEDDPKGLKHVVQLKINIATEVCCVDGHKSICSVIHATGC